MVNKEQLDYVKLLKDRGYSDDTIREQLSKHGYTGDQINELFQNYKVKELVVYIKSVREKGYSDDTIKKNLPNYGYTQNTIDEAYKGISTEKVKKRRINPFIFVGLGLIILVITIFFIIDPFFLVTSQTCEGASLKIYELNEEPVLCIYPDNTKIQMIIENNGTVKITDAEIIVKGKKRVTDKLNDLNLMPGDVFTRVVNYDPTSGQVREVIITPFIVKDDKKIKCTADRISFTEFKTC